MTTNPSRRAVLAGAALLPALAVPAIAVRATPDAAFAAVASTTEDAALLALGREADALIAAYRTAERRYCQARDIAKATCPPVPDELVAKKGMYWAFGCVEHKVDVEGKLVWPPNYVGADGKTYARPYRNIFKSELLKAAVKQGNVYSDRRTTFGKNIWKLIASAEQYEQKRKDSIDASGLGDASWELREVGNELNSLVVKMYEVAPKTMEGILILARTCVAHAQAQKFEYGYETWLSVLPRQMAESLIRVQGARQALAVQS